MISFKSLTEAGVSLDKGPSASTARGVGNKHRQRHERAEPSVATNLWAILILASPLLAAASGTRETCKVQGHPWYA